MRAPSIPPGATKLTRRIGRNPPRPRPLRNFRLRISSIVPRRLRRRPRLPPSTSRRRPIQRPAQRMIRRPPPGRFRPRRCRHGRLPPRRPRLMRLHRCARRHRPSGCCHPPVLCVSRRASIPERWPIARIPAPTRALPNRREPGTPARVRAPRPAEKRTASLPSGRAGEESQPATARSPRRSTAALDTAARPDLPRSLRPRPSAEPAPSFGPTTISLPASLRPTRIQPSDVVALRPSGLAERLP